MVTRVPRPAGASVTVCARVRPGAASRAAAKSGNSRRETGEVTKPPENLLGTISRRARGLPRRIAMECEGRAPGIRPCGWGAWTIWCKRPGGFGCRRANRARTGRGACPRPPRNRPACAPVERRLLCRPQPWLAAPVRCPGVAGRAAGFPHRLPGAALPLARTRPPPSPRDRVGASSGACAMCPPRAAPPRARRRGKERERMGGARFGRAHATPQPASPARLTPSRRARERAGPEHGFP